jgi:hypothetical protein
MVDLEEMDEADEPLVKELLERHVKYTDSRIAGELLLDWNAARARFTKVMPRDYKRALAGLITFAGMPAPAAAAAPVTPVSGEPPVPEMA